MDKEDSASSNSSRTRTRLRHRPFMLLDKFHNRFHSSKKVEATEPVLHKEPSVNRMSLLAEEDEYMHCEDEDMISAHEEPEICCPKPQLSLNPNMIQHHDSDLSLIHI